MLHLRAAFQQADVPIRIPVVAANSIGVCAVVQQNVGVGLIHPLQLTGQLFPGLIMRPFRPRVALRTFIYTSAYQQLSKPGAILVNHLMHAARDVIAGSRESATRNSS